MVNKFSSFPSEIERNFGKKKSICVDFLFQFQRLKKFKEISRGKHGRLNPHATRSAICRFHFLLLFEFEK